ncbi:MAG: PEP-CTERM sorting domain-containing protein [Bryobacteraceae bacterium]|nr:PEP-CTERM sorting domain-containing protein [Bryobacteraceae bacterium]
MPAWGGSIVVNHDEWTTSNTGFSNAGGSNAANFVLNAANFLTGGSGDILIYSTNFSLNQSSFLNTLTGAGYTVQQHSVNPIATFDLASISGFEAIFLAGPPVPANLAVLTAYVNQGGSVYLAGGTAGIGSAADEAAAWNPFLNAFGLSFGSPFNGVSGNIAPSTSHPLFSGVAQLYYNNGNTVSAIGPGASIIATNSQGLGLIGIATPVPEPATTLLTAAGALGLWLLRRRAA